MEWPDWMKSRFSGKAEGQEPVHPTSDSPHPLTRHLFLVLAGAAPLPSALSRKPAGPTQRQGVLATGTGGYLPMHNW